MYHDIEDQAQRAYCTGYSSDSQPARSSHMASDLEDATCAEELDYDNMTASRPDNLRSSTDPSPAMLMQNYFAVPVKQQSTTTRNRSPYSRSHLRSRSSGSALAPPMVRAHSMPAVHSLSRSYELSNPATPSLSSLSSSSYSSHSPQRSPARVRSPLIAEYNDSTSYFPPPRSPHWYETSTGGPIESIQEDSELDLTPRNSAAFPSTHPIPAPPITLASRTGSMRRRPASPLHSLVAASPTSHPVCSSDSGQESPALGPAKFTEALPSSFQLNHYASTSSFSSISSTPSSARSRSPSISSLETIEDAPDAEYEALEADRLWRLQLSEKGERGEEAGDDTYKRKGFGFGRGRNSERKRWSVCGGERRADLDLETIWED